MRILSQFYEKLGELRGLILVLGPPRLAGGGWGRRWLEVMEEGSWGV